MHMCVGAHVCACISRCPLSPAARSRRSRLFSPGSLHAGCSALRGGCWVMYSALGRARAWSTGYVSSSNLSTSNLPCGFSSTPKETKEENSAADMQLHHKQIQQTDKNVWKQNECKSEEPKEKDKWWGKWWHAEIKSQEKLEPRKTSELEDCIEFCNCAVTYTRSKELGRLVDNPLR